MRVVILWTISKWYALALSKWHAMLVGLLDFSCCFLFPNISTLSLLCQLFLPWTSSLEHFLVVRVGLHHLLPGTALTISRVDHFLVVNAGLDQVFGVIFAWNKNTTFWFLLLSETSFTLGWVLQSFLECLLDHFWVVDLLLKMSFTLGWVLHAMKTTALATRV